MKKVFITLVAISAYALVQAQPPMGMMMGGYTQPFYMTESDSVAESRIDQIADVLKINEKQSKKMTKLISQEYEETCRNIQMSVMESQMSGMGGGMRDYGFGGGMPAQQTSEPQGIDTTAVIATTDKIAEKYEKRYKKVLDENQLAEWNKLEKDRRLKELPDLLT